MTDRQPHTDSNYAHLVLPVSYTHLGSVSDPEKIYHLEIVTHNETYANSLANLINEFGLSARTIGRKSYYVVYLKDGGHIVDFLSIIGAHAALLELENIRICLLYTSLVCKFPR